MKLTYNEIANLAVEINGNGRDFKGILKQKVSMKVKVQIHRLNQIVQDELKIFEELRKELFQKFGEEKNGTITIPPDKISDFQPEFEELLSMEKEINATTLWTTPLKIDDIEAMETEEFYPTIIKVIEG
jgi:uncharacterized HAD superfamily protein